VRVLVTCVAALALGLVAGCGGGGDSGGSGGDRLSQSEFVSQANAICKDVNDRIDAVDAPTSVADLAEPTQKVKDIYDDGISKMQDINPPASAEDDFNEFIDISQQQSDRLSQIVDAAKAGDAAKVTQITNEGSTADKRSDTLATKMGLDECASN
jgi:hypothetical protein